MDVAYGKSPVLLTSEGVPASRPYGFIMGGDGRLLAAQLTGLCIIFLWVVGFLVPFFWVIKWLGWLRVNEAEEKQGLDVSHHGGSAYPPETTYNVQDGQHLMYKTIENPETTNKNEDFNTRLQAIENFLQSQDENRVFKKE
eukprot:TRINITY_DN11543_c0_g2_i3.p2 TRINITY_DN11543_c0_g2~~TRINITY_DN11543_c0_g2_i3.p2  ORF type:complete len:141 (+),score=28.18 TRINITY_DN11543_c0_g2_i3:66-488(+)